VKLIIAIIRPEKLESVQASLNPSRVTLMSVSQVISFGQEPAFEERYRGVVCQKRPAKLRMEFVVNDAGVDEAVEAIVRSGASSGAGRLGDGEIFVMNMEECVRICSREREATVGMN
jgi:nitrogen regulatory protein PII